MISVFAVEDTAVQVVWRALPAPRVTFAVDGRSVTVEPGPPALLSRAGRAPGPLRMTRGSVGGPGGVTIDGLRPGTRYQLTMTGAGVSRRPVESFATLEAPPGPLLTKFATINDLHLAEPGFGARKRHPIEESWPLPPGWAPYSWRCTKSAIDEAIEWGAAALVVKGDLTADGAPAEYHEIGELLAAVPVPVIVTLGNHEFHDLVTDSRPILARYGIDVPREPWAHDLPGIRVICGLTPRPGHKSGRIDDRQRAQLVALAAEAPGPVFLALHHQLQRWPVPTTYPPGVGARQAQALLDALVEANPATLVAGGHTHRHRRRQHGPIEVVGIGSPKDYPGTWAGYAVHQGGIRQVVRRTVSPEVIGWTETTARAVAGVWGQVSPGKRSWRCFTHAWPDREFDRR